MFLRINKQEKYYSDGKYVLFYPDGKDDAIKLTGEQVMKMFEEAYLSGMIEKPSKKYMADLYCSRIIRRHG